MAVPATVLVSAASLPEGAKLGFCFSRAAEGFATVSGEGAALLPLKAACWDGRGPRARLLVVGDGERGFWVRRGGEDEALLRRAGRRERKGLRGREGREWWSRGLWRRLMGSWSLE